MEVQCSLVQFGLLLLPLLLASGRVICLDLPLTLVTFSSSESASNYYR